MGSRLCPIAPLWRYGLLTRETWRGCSYRWLADQDPEPAAVRVESPEPGTWWPDFGPPRSTPIRGAKSARWRATHRSKRARFVSVSTPALRSSTLGARWLSSKTPGRTFHDKPTCIVRATAHASATKRAKVGAEFFTQNGK